MFIKNNKGQTILEALISITVVVVGLFSVLVLILINIRASDTSNDKLTASMLSWEGIEIVRNIRDSNWLAGTSNWNEGLFSGTDYTAIPVFDSFTGTWSLDFSPNTIVSDDSTKVYKKGSIFLQNTIQPVGSQPTIFYRLIKIQPDSDVDPYMLTVTTEIRWQIKGEWRKTKAEEIFYNWK